MFDIVSLFSGVGGLEMGLEWAGLGSVAAQVELDPYCHQILERNWPHARRFHDIRTVSPTDIASAIAAAHALRVVETHRAVAAAPTVRAKIHAAQRTTERPTLFCGGFPCQDISRRGKGHGIHGARSGLWAEYWRLIAGCNPDLVVLENSAQLVKRGLEVVLADLAALGYDAWWDCIPASAVGAPHLRDRVFLVARRRSASANSAQLAHAASAVLGTEEHREHSGPPSTGRQASTDDRRSSVSNKWRRDCELGLARLSDGFPARLYTDPHAGEVPRTAPRPPGFRNRHRMIGNAVVPQVAYLIGCAIRNILDEENKK